jgi:hypothetical protein
MTHSIFCSASNDQIDSKNSFSLIERKKTLSNYKKQAVGIFDFKGID